MGMGRVVVLVAYAVLFVLATPRNSGGWLAAHGFSVATSSDAEEEKVEQEIWSDCWMKSIVGALNLLKPDENPVDSTSLYLKKQTSLREDLQESLHHLPSGMKHSLLECLISKDRFVRLVLQNAPTNRQPRKLARSQDQQLSRSLPHYSQASPGGAKDGPLQDNNEVTLHEDSTYLSPAPSPGGYLKPVGTNPAPRHVVMQSEQKSNKRTVIIAVVVTASVTFTLSAICFCCFYRYLWGKYLSDKGKRDERPLLSLSLNDFSGSSNVSFGLGNSIKKHGSLFFKADSLDSPSDTEINEGHATISTSTKLTNASNNASVPLPPPPPPRKLPPHQMASHVPSASPSPPQLPPSEHVPEPPNVGPPALKPGPPPPKGGPIPPKLPRQAQIGSNSSSIPYPPPTHSSDASGSISAKTKLKPFFWDKVAANPDQSMVWHQIKSGSFQFNEEMIETLFGYNAADKHRNDAMKDFANDISSRRIQILDSKKSQNLAISIKAKNVKVEEVCDALMEGNELPVELLQVLLRMAPTADEELKLRLFNDQTAMLGTAEQFLKSLLNIPFAFKRMEALLFMTTLREESSFVKESLTILEEACKELRNSRLFLKLLEAVLKTGNRMNDGTYRGGAQAFKLDTLLKLSDVKGADGKTTLLHFVVQEIIRSEGRRAVHVAVENRSNPNVSIPSLSSQHFAEGVTKESEDQYCTIGLRVVSGLSSELENVKRAAGLDADALASYLSSLHQRLEKSRGFMNTDMRNLEEESNFHDSLKAFVVHADAEIAFLMMEEKRIKLLVKNTTDYFHGSAGRDEGLRLFVIVRDFLGMLQKACKDVREAPMQVIKTPRNKGNTTRQMLFPSIRDRRVNDSSSDEERS